MKPPKCSRTHWRRLISFSLVLMMVCSLSVPMAQAAAPGWG